MSSFGKQRQMADPIGKRKNLPARNSLFEMILVDVGGVLVKDEPVEARYLWSVQQALEEWAPEMTPTSFFRCREARSMRGDDDWVDDLAVEVLGKRRWSSVKEASWAAVLDSWIELTVPIEGAVETIRELSTRVRLAVAANQPKQALLSLDAMSISECFEFIAIDAELPFSKPDTRFYEWIVSRGKVEPENVLMIGDRIDNDILPAGRLGMKTAWLNCAPKPDDVPGMPATWLQHYYGSVARVGKHNQHVRCPAAASAKPDFRATSLQNLAELI